MAYTLSEITNWVSRQEKTIPPEVREELIRRAIAVAETVLEEKLVASGILDEVLGVHTKAFRDAWERGEAKG